MSVMSAERLSPENMSTSEPGDIQSCSFTLDACERGEEMADKMTEVSPGEFIYIPLAAREAFRRPAFAYTVLCPVLELRPRFEKVKEERN